MNERAQDGVCGHELVVVVTGFPKSVGLSLHNHRKLQVPRPKGPQPDPPGTQLAWRPTPP